jgi:hypothetical protein
MKTGFNGEQLDVFFMLFSVDANRIIRGRLRQRQNEAATTTSEQVHLVQEGTTLVTAADITNMVTSIALMFVADSNRIIATITLRPL